MTKLDDNCTLVVKHLPQELTYQEREELLTNFGATRIRCTSDAGRLKQMAFALFPSHQHAKAALSRLHQLEILGCVLSAEFAKTSQSRHFPLMSEFKNFQEKEAQPEEGPDTMDLSRKLEGFTRRLHEIGPDIGLNYFPSPLLRYSYPPPSPTVLANISNALASVPKFYTQVLHLMNKMNLPSPFGPLTPRPPLHPDPEFALEPELQPILFPPPASSSSESELESEQEEPSLAKPCPPKRQAPRIRPPTVKKPRLEQMLSAPPTVQANTAPSEPPVSVQKKISIIAPSAMSEPTVTAAAMEVEQGGFGTIAPTGELPKSPSSHPTSVEDEMPSSFISMEDLEKNKISTQEMQHLSAFRSYSPGAPSTRLYLKNLAKHVTEKDLYQIFGQFIDQTSEAEKEMFNIVLMKEGRMKGQAFITLASEEQTQKAVNLVNGYKIYDKPMVVQFARSQKKTTVQS